MKLKDLKQGMICELRNGYEIIILSNDSYVFDNLDRVVYQLSKDYNDDLTHQVQKDYDIMKVTFGKDVIIDRSESNPFFKPKKDEEYFYVGNGRVWSYKNDSEYDDDILKTDIVFKTEEEAERALLKKQAKIRVIKEIARLNQGWDVREHWGNDDIAKYYIVYSSLNSNLHHSTVYHLKVLDNNLYLKTGELAEQLIETHSDDLKLMLELENE